MTLIQKNLYESGEKLTMLSYSIENKEATLPELYRKIGKEIIKLHDIREIIGNKLLEYVEASECGGVA